MIFVYNNIGKNLVTLVTSNDTKAYRANVKILHWLPFVMRLFVSLFV